MERAGGLREEFVTLEEVVSPAPWLALRNGVDIPAEVADYVDHHPGATPDDVVHELAKSGAEVNGALVAQQLLDRSRQGPTG